MAPAIGLIRGAIYTNDRTATSSLSFIFSSSSRMQVRVGSRVVSRGVPMRSARLKMIARVDLERSSTSTLRTVLGNPRGVNMFSGDGNFKELGEFILTKPLHISYLITHSLS
jgi:hypothetical protein